jgi:hypothetical protein
MRKSVSAENRGIASAAKHLPVYASAQIAERRHSAERAASGQGR